MKLSSILVFIISATIAFSLYTNGLVVTAALISVSPVSILFGFITGCGFMYLSSEPIGYTIIGHDNAKMTLWFLLQGLLSGVLGSIIGFFWGQYIFSVFFKLF